MEMLGTGMGMGTGLGSPHSHPAHLVPRRCSPAPHPTWNSHLKGRAAGGFSRVSPGLVVMVPSPTGDAVGEDGGSFPHVLGVAGWTPGAQDHECIPLCKVLLTLQTHLVPKRVLGSSRLWLKCSGLKTNFLKSSGPPPVGWAELAVTHLWPDVCKGTENGLRLQGRPGCSHRVRTPIGRKAVPTPPSPPWGHLPADTREQGRLHLHPSLSLISV